MVSPRRKEIRFGSDFEKDISFSLLLVELNFSVMRPFLPEESVPSDMTLVLEPNIVESSFSATVSLPGLKTSCLISALTITS